ncbi:ABC transporter permease [Halobacillus sp. A5]|uniref:ABC transporter permease n=1 Tax=Halobacillus sp. A5 TaxID=2880263 RepID=UPI0020A6C058|nr:ABC transporter permease subunit [Halobacillus sp. A5]MCP3029501.1 ABC transporter permease subunit [Halobacillus sp. A5]
MITISLKEFTSLFKSIRSIIIISIIFGVTLGSAKLINTFQAELAQFDLGSSAYAAGLMLIIIIASPLFVSSLSHNVINEELKSRTIRFIATKISRNRIIAGKFLGILLFWSLCLFVALLLTIPFSKTFPISEFFQSIVFISYFVGLTILLSTLIHKPSLSILTGIALALVFPILGLWSVFSDNFFLKVFSYLTPYLYFSKEQELYSFFVLIFPVIFLVISLMIMRKRDL